MAAGHGLNYLEPEWATIPPELHTFYNTPSADHAAVTALLAQHPELLDPWYSDALHARAKHYAFRRRAKKEIDIGVRHVFKAAQLDVCAAAAVGEGKPVAGVMEEMATVRSGMRGRWMDAVRRSVRLMTMDELRRMKLANMEVALVNAEPVAVPCVVKGNGFRLVAWESVAEGPGKMAAEEMLGRSEPKGMREFKDAVWTGSLEGLNEAMQGMELEKAYEMLGLLVEVS